MTNKKPEKAIIERHMQTILTFIITGLIAWVGTSVANQRTEIALLQQSMDTMQKQIVRFTDMPRFSHTDFDNKIVVYKAKLIEIDQHFKRDDGRIDNLLGRVRKLEENFIITHRND